MGVLGMREASAAASTVMRGQLSRFGTGGTSQTERLEAELARHVGVPHVRAMNSGTSALVCGLVGLGVGPGDEVLVPAYTWVSTAAAVLNVGAVPVLVEVDESLTLDPNDLRAKIRPATRAIIAVHMLNLVCDMDSIMSMAYEHDLQVIEDACQAIGVTWRGRQAGSIGDVAAFSFNQHKNLRAGEGGALLCSDSAVFVRASMFHDVGSYMRADRLETDVPVIVGMNFRMSEVTSAILRPQLRRLDRQIERRRARRRMLIDELASVSGLRVAPHHAPDEAVGLAVQFDDPEQAKRFANARGVERLADTGRHLYTNWDSVRSGRMYHEQFDPYRWASDRRPGADHCPKTLEIVERTCNIALAPDVPLPVLRRLARDMAAM